MDPLGQRDAPIGRFLGGTRWTRHTFIFTADSGTSTLTFCDHSASTKSLDLVLDNVRVT